MHTTISWINCLDNFLTSFFFHTFTPNSHQFYSTINNLKDSSRGLHIKMTILMTFFLKMYIFCIYILYSFFLINTVKFVD
ncbi:hypothetical protein CW304_18280 [Bacillus sp. UFRGS-B20]|nr:hypothetical protein CW304_18280 [Bacillus sp. UFRGS-B20]